MAGSTQVVATKRVNGFDVYSGLFVHNRNLLATRFQSALPVTAGDAGMRLVFVA